MTPALKELLQGNLKSLVCFISNQITKFYFKSLTNFNPVLFTVKRLPKPFSTPSQIVFFLSTQADTDYIKTFSQVFVSSQSLLFHTTVFMFSSSFSFHPCIITSWYAYKHYSFLFKTLHEDFSRILSKIYALLSVEFVLNQLSRRKTRVFP